MKKKKLSFNLLIHLLDHQLLFAMVEMMVDALKLLTLFNTLSEDQVEWQDQEIQMRSLNQRRLSRKNQFLVKQPIQQSLICLLASSRLMLKSYSKMLQQANQSLFAMVIALLR